MRTIPLDAQALDSVEVELEKVPLLAALDAAKRRAVAGCAALWEVAGGERLVRQGEESRDFLLLLDGEAHVSVHLPGEDEELEVAILSAGASLGEMAVLLGEPRTATVVATRRSRLLRFDEASLVRALEEVPAFGLALSRELARRLKAELAAKNELQAELAPEVVDLEQPDVNRQRAYLTRYFATTVGSMLRRHQLIVEKRFPRYRVPFSFTEEERRRWLDLYAASGTEAATPFTYFTTAATLGFMRVVSDVGVNFRNLVYLRSEMTYSPRGLHATPGQPYTIRFQLVDILELREDRVALVVQGNVEDAQGRLVEIHKEYFAILHLDPEYLEPLRSVAGFGRHDATDLVNLSQRKTTLAVGAPGVERRSIAVPADMGTRFGKVSGELSIHHTTKLAARMFFGHDKPFIQGLCVANYILRALTGASGAPPLSFRITYARRVFVDQTVELLFDEGRFELQDGAGQLLTFGSWEPRRAG